MKLLLTGLVLAEEEWMKKEWMLKEAVINDRNLGGVTFITFSYCWKEVQEILSSVYNWRSPFSGQQNARNMAPVH